MADSGTVNQSARKKKLKEEIIRLRKKSKENVIKIKCLQNKIRRLVRKKMNKDQLGTEPVLKRQKKIMDDSNSTEFESSSSSSSTSNIDKDSSTSNIDNGDFDSETDFYIKEERIDESEVIANSVSFDTETNIFAEIKEDPLN